MLLVVDGQVICMRMVALLRIPITEKVAKDYDGKCHDQNNAKSPRGLHVCLWSPSHYDLTRSSIRHWLIVCANKRSARFLCVLYRNHDQRTSPLPLDDNTILTTPPRSTICPIHSRGLKQQPGRWCWCCAEIAPQQTQESLNCLFYISQGLALLSAIVGLLVIGQCQCGIAHTGIDV